MNKIYAGIGSRKTTIDILSKMRDIAIELAKKDYVLRSGGARGADMIFEEGCDAIGGKKEIFKAADATEEAMTHASHFHPAWIKCNDYARLLHGRNSMIVLGENLDAPVAFIVCWTSEGELIGGTAQALRIAVNQDIKIYNLFKEVDVQDLIIFIAEQ